MQRKLELLGIFLKWFCTIQGSTFNHYHSLKFYFFSKMTQSMLLLTDELYMLVGSRDSGISINNCMTIY